MGDGNMGELTLRDSAGGTGRQPLPRIACLAPSDASVVPYKANTIDGLGRRADVRQVYEPVALLVSPIDVNTRDGRPGSQGQNGSAGDCGKHSGPYHSGPGGPGGDGERGRDGSPGGDGARGEDNRNVQINVFNKAGGVMVWRSDTRQSLPVNVNQPGFVLVDTKGGKGGVGGIGGAGGNGGEGGRGGPGARGRRGADGGHSRYNNNGHSGGRGHDGGPGGREGDSGDGAPGGTGGDAGFSGSIVVCADESEAALLWLVESDARMVAGALGGHGGSPGVPGRGGRGGLGGAGGAGGSGRTVNDGDSFSMGRSGSTGPRGSDGPAGPPGDRGEKGQEGRRGRDGRAGNITWCLTRNGQIVEAAPDRFDVGVSEYTVIDEDDDGIFSPGSMAFVTDINLRNIGEMTLPGGALVDIFADLPSVHIPHAHTLPSLGPNDAYNVSEKFPVMITDAGEPGLTTYTSSFNVSSRVSMLGRAFPEAQVGSYSIPVSWPVRISKVECTDWLGPNEVSSIKVTVENISRKPYGGDDLREDGGNSLGTVQVRFVVDDLLEIKPGQPLPHFEGASTVDYIIEDGHKVAVCTLPEIPAHSSVTVAFTFAVQSEASSKLFSLLPHRTDLLLNDRCIEYRKATIRVTPIFVAGVCTDIALVTSGDMAREEFLAWSYLLQCLSLSVNFWDIQRYDGLASPEISWVGTCRTLIVPSRTLPHTSASLKHRYPIDVSKFLRFSDVYTHMTTTFPGDAGLATTFPQTGVLIMGEHADATPLMYDMLQPVLGSLNTKHEYVTFQKLDPTNPSQVPTHLPAPPSVTTSDHTFDRTVPCLSPLPAPTLPEGIDAPENPKADFTLSGCGACCDTCFGCCCDACSGNPEKIMSRFQRSLVEADPSRQYLIAHNKVNALGYHLGEMGCFSSETIPIAVFPCLYPRDAHIMAIKHQAVLTHDWVPFTFDGVMFNARNEPWQDNTFAQTMRAVLHLLPVEKRVSLLANPFLQSLSLIRSTDGGVTSLAFVIAMSLTRSIMTQQRSKAGVNIASRIAGVVGPHLGENARYVLYALLGPHVDDDEIKSLGMNAAKSIGIKDTDAYIKPVTESLTTGDKDLVALHSHFTTWGRGLILPCDDANAALLEQPYETGKNPYITVPAACDVASQGISWTYSIADYNYRARKAHADAATAQAAMYSPPSPQHQCSAAFHANGALVTAQPQEIAARPAPPPQTFQLSDGSGMGTPQLYHNDGKRDRYMASQVHYQHELSNYQHNLAPQVDQGMLSEHGTAPPAKGWAEDELVGPVPTFAACDDRDVARRSRREEEEKKEMAAVAEGLAAEAGVETPLDGENDQSAVNED